MSWFYKKKDKQMLRQNASTVNLVETSQIEQKSRLEKEGSIASSDFQVNKIYSSDAANNCDDKKLFCDIRISRITFKPLGWVPLKVTLSMTTRTLPRHHQGQADLLKHIKNR